ncbi:MAG: hypothetical protein MJY60_01560 [Bacteroidales bacterium]|nr:hypothetical protein [Bacteroidales bacterium]
MRRRFRKFVEGAPYHYCTKGLNGFCIFYSFKDYLFLITLYSIVAEDMGITTLVFTPMINHLHSLMQASVVHQLSSFVCRFESIFAVQYNEYHHRTGQLFKHRFSGASKTVGKVLRGSIIYVLNNPVVGKIVSKVINYRWNLLAYATSTHPYSEQLIIRNASAPMKKAVKTVDAMHRSGLYLSYSVLDELFSPLNRTETRQLIDYIISTYKIIDYDALASIFGSLENAIISAEAGQGGEYDIQDDWDDYGVYTKMIRVLDQCGFNSDFNPESLNGDTLSELYNRLAREVGASPTQLRKFLHLKAKSKI